MKIKLKVPKFKMLLLLMTIVMVIALAACTSTTLFTSNPAEAPTPNIEFLVPGEHSYGEGVFGKYWFPVSVNVSNFLLVDKLGDPNVAGEGHIHYFLDVDPPTEPGKPAVTTTGTYADTADTFHYWYKIGGGTHTFSAELVNNDHTPLDSPVIAKVTITESLYWDG